MTRRLRARIGFYLTIAVILVIAIFPFCWMVDTSFKQPVDIFGGVTLYPHHPTTANYSRLFNTYHFAVVPREQPDHRHDRGRGQPRHRHARRLRAGALPPAASA